MCSMGEGLLVPFGSRAMCGVGGIPGRVLVAEALVGLHAALGCLLQEGWAA